MIPNSSFRETCHLCSVRGACDLCTERGPSQRSRREGRLATVECATEYGGRCTGADVSERRSNAQRDSLCAEIEGRIPAVIVFHAASNPTRDNPLYAHLVEMLPPLGIAVFVFDRRGSGKSEGKLESSDYSMLADDGATAHRMLTRDHRIDPRRIGFWGLSQGGWLSLLAASRSPQAAFAISISAPMNTPDVQMNFAVANILRIKGFSEADIDQAIATRTAVDDFQRGKRDRASAQNILDVAATKPWFVHTYLEKTFKDPDQSRWAMEMRHDPMATLDAVKQPTLVIYGSADPWVPVQTSRERLRASSARHPNVEVAVIAGADHAMATSVSTADQIEPDLSAKQAPQSAAYFGLLGAWLAKQGSCVSRNARLTLRDRPSDCFRRSPAAALGRQPLLSQHSTSGFDDVRRRPLAAVSDRRKRS